MTIVALTGGIGSGKSTVAEMFRKLGVPVYDSDRKAKELMESSPKLRKAVKGLLGDGAYKDKTLNREFIAQKVFGNKELLLRLNGIVHPAVREDFVKWSKEQKSPYVIQESAIVFENGIQDFYDKVILVTAPKEIRIQRVVQRDGSTTSEIMARMGNQWDDSRKISMADYVIENISLKTTDLKVREVHGLLVEP